MIRKAVIISISGIILTQQEKIFFKNDKPWGVIFFRRNIVSEKQVIKLTSSIRKIMKDRKYPILIDEEGGTVTRLSNIFNNSNYNQKYFGNIYSIDKKIGSVIYKNYIDLISAHLRNLGININTSPVLDLYKEKAHKIIGNRSYSKSNDILLVNIKINPIVYPKHEMIPL